MANMGTIQLWPPVTVNGIIQTLIYRLALHPLIANPPIWDVTGNQVRINKFRNFDGLELKNPSGITLSVFPYHMANSDASTNLTTESSNASIVFKPHTLGGGHGQDMTAMDEATANIMLKLHAFGYSQQSEADGDIVNNQSTQFEFNYIQWALYQYGELLASALRSRELRKLPRFADNKFLLANSFVNYVDHPTSRWEQGGNLVLHSATVLWQVKYYVVREWKRPPRYVPAEMSGSNVRVGYLNTPSGVPEDILYDTLQHRYIRADGSVVARTDLNDPATGSPYDTLDAELILLIDTAPRSQFDLSFYFKRVDG